MVAAPALPDGPTEAATTGNGIVAQGRPCRVFRPRLAILAERNNDGGPARRDGRMAGAGILGTIGRDHADALIGGKSPVAFDQNAAQHEP